MTNRSIVGLQASIVATVRNERATIKPFIESLVAQSRPADEIIIVDGASTDGTLELLEDYARDNTIRLVSEPCNIARGRNLGIAAAKGNHIAVTDAGCNVDADWLEKLLLRFEENPSLDVVAGNFRFDTRSQFEKAVVLSTFSPNRDDSDSARFYPSSRSVAFKKSAWERAGGYPEWLYAAEDTLFNIRLRQIGCEFSFCREAIVRWRPRETWKALARQRINFSRGNARVGIGTSGYVKNLKIHGLTALLLILAFSIGEPLLLIPAIVIFGWHVHVHLWPQAAISTAGESWSLRLLVLTVMEFVRLVTMYGFLLGRWDRWRDPSFIANQKRYMGFGSVDELDAKGLL